MASDKATGHRTSTLLAACLVSFLVGRQMSTANFGLSACLSSSSSMTDAENVQDNATKAGTVVVTDTTLQNNDTGWHQIDVFYGDSSFLQKRVPPTKTWTSQVRQDELVWLLLRKRVKGYFVDLASNDATYLSNTYTLETVYLWNGLCIEANPKYWHGLASRPRCQVVGAVVGHKTMQQVDFTYKANGDAFTLKDGGLYGGIVNADFDNKMTDKKGFVTEPRYTVKLSDLFERYNVPSVIDYLSLDVEGAESYIMQDFPFANYTIQVMTVERPKKDLKELLNKNGYVFLDTIAKWGETLYCHKSVLSRLDFTSAGMTPPDTVS